jgi:hypothetical protein
MVYTWKRYNKVLKPVIKGIFIVIQSMFFAWTVYVGVRVFGFDKSGNGLNDLDGCPKPPLRMDGGSGGIIFRNTIYLVFFSVMFQLKRIQFAIDPTLVDEEQIYLYMYRLYLLEKFYQLLYLVLMLLSIVSIIIFYATDDVGYSAKLTTSIVITSFGIMFMVLTVLLILYFMKMALFFARTLEVNNIV